MRCGLIWRAVHMNRSAICSVISKTYESLLGKVRHFSQQPPQQLTSRTDAQNRDFASYPAVPKLRPPPKAVSAKAEWTANRANSRMENSLGLSCVLSCVSSTLKGIFSWHFFHKSWSRLHRFLLRWVRCITSGVRLTDQSSSWATARWLRLQASERLGLRSRRLTIIDVISWVHRFCDNWEVNYVLNLS